MGTNQSLSKCRIWAPDVSRDLLAKCSQDPLVILVETQRTRVTQSLDVFRSFHELVGTSVSWERECFL